MGKRFEVGEYVYVCNDSISGKGVYGGYDNTDQFPHKVGLHAGRLPAGYSWFKDEEIEPWSGQCVEPKITVWPDFAPYVLPTPPTMAQVRKGRPVASGVLAYFPDAIDAIAEVSRRGNDQHNPGQPLHWARDKSKDQLDAAVRHIMDHMRGVKVDSEGNRTLAQAAWRIMAECQIDIEKESGK